MMEKEKLEGRSFKLHFGVVVLLFIFSVLITGCGSKFDTLPESEVDSEMRTDAERIGSTLLKAHREGCFEPLGDEASDIMRSSYTPDQQKKSYEHLKSVIGEFESMEYVETCVPKEGQRFYVFRFKGEFSKNKNVEVRIVINEDGKLDGFWVKPWKNKL